jgi:hypothetical protein
VCSSKDLAKAMGTTRTRTKLGTGCARAFLPVPARLQFKGWPLFFRSRLVGGCASLISLSGSLSWAWVSFSSVLEASFDSLVFYFACGDFGCCVEDFFKLVKRLFSKSLSFCFDLVSDGLDTG